MSAAAVARKLALGLTAAHAQKVIHRDLKPANVLYDEANREVLIADFGLARLADQATDASNGVPKGTPAYMAPEQARGEPVDARADVFALGVVAYELLAGVRPFDGEDAADTLSRVKSGRHVPLDHIAADLRGVAGGQLARHPKADLERVHGRLCHRHGEASLAQVHNPPLTAATGWILGHRDRGQPLRQGRRSEH